MSKWMILITAIFFAAGSVQAAQTAKKRPRIGLVLGGGGARGFAHIGILKVLEDNHIPVDCIVGTSIGSLVGGSYAAGRTPEEMRKLVKAADWNTLLYAQAPREAFPYRRKQDDKFSMLNVEIGIADNGQVKLPSAAISTQQIELFLRSLTYGGTVKDFDQLSIPFRAIATDLVTGDMVVLKDGDLVTAMRASMAVPGVFPAVPTGGRVLVDGGLVRNLGVDVAKQTCADVVFAIDVGAPPLSQDQINNILSVADQYTRLMMIQNVNPQKKSLSHADVVMTPEFGDLGSSDFEKSDTMYAIGEKAALKSLDQLKRYAVSDEEFKKWETHREKNKLKAKPIKEVSVGSSGWTNPDVLKSALKVKTGELLPQDDFANHLTNLYARGDFSQLDYELLDATDGQKLYILPVLKSWGPNYLNLGLSLGTDFDTSYPWNLTAMYRRTWVNDLGAEWKSIVQVGSSAMYYTEFYQPLQLSGSSFVSPYFRFTRNPVAVWSSGVHVAQYEYSKSSVGLDVGAGFTKFGEVRLGAVYNDSEASLEIGSPLLDSAREYDYGLRLSLYFDQLDNYFFPTRGQYLNLYGYYSLGASENLENYGLAGFEFRAGTPIGHGAIQWTLKAQTTQGKSNETLANINWLGGFLNLSSYHYQELLGEQFAYGSGQYYHPLGLLSGTYWGFAAEIGRVFDYVERDIADKWHNSVTLYFAYDSVLGPMYLAGAYGDNHAGAMYFMLGKQF